uniref:Reverse transcriptase domain-containing protein n=1 Tax=Tanacetum cinerariifolium TaxID=118510 RepID=A0A699H7G1_TANCI|nr:reverse transcriptase domain-containing protein [Tanacetum cinerariifolium]
MPCHIKTYDESEYPEDHLKTFQAAAKTKRWAMPTWCHMFNFTLAGNVRVWFDNLPQESIDSYDDLKKAFLENYLRQKKCNKYPIEIHNIKQRDGESTEEFVQSNPELIKRLHDKIPKSVDEMMRVTTSFLKGEVTASNRVRKNSFPLWKQQEAVQKQNFKKGGFRNQQRSEQKPDSKVMGKTKQRQYKRETSVKDKPLTILMVQPWQRVAKQRITQTFSLETVISFPPLGQKDETEGPMIIEAEIEGHFVHRIYVDGGSSSANLYEHCFNRFRPKVRSQMVPAATPLVGFSGEIIWPLGQISLLVKIGDEEHSTSAWMNFMVVRLPSPYNEIIGRQGRIIPLECTIVSGPGTQQPVIDQVTEEKIQVAIHPEYPEQTIAIGSTLTQEGQKEPCGLLRRNLDIFA